MTDISAPQHPLAKFRLDTTSAEAKARVRARYRSEGRFKAYGLFALALTTTFRVVHILQKCGFKPEGVWREHGEKNGVVYDTHVFGLLRREWEELRRAREGT